MIDSIFGLASESEQISLLEGILAGNLGDVLNRVKECETHGTDLRRLTEDLIQDLKDGIIWQYTKDAAYLHALKEEHANAFETLPVSKLLAMIDVLMKAQERYRTARSVTSVFEIACLELMNPAEAAVPSAEPVPVRTAYVQPAPPVQSTAPAKPVQNEPVKNEPEPEPEPEKTPEPAEKPKPPVKAV